MESFEESFARISTEIEKAHAEMAQSHADFDKRFEARRAEIRATHVDYNHRSVVAKRTAPTAQKQHRACRTVHSHVQQHHDLNMRLHQEEHQRFMDQQSQQQMNQMHMQMHHGF